MDRWMGWWVDEGVRYIPIYIRIILPTYFLMLYISTYYSTQLRT